MSGHQQPKRKKEKKRTAFTLESVQTHVNNSEIGKDQRRAKIKGKDQNQCEGTK